MGIHNCGLSDDLRKKAQRELLGSPRHAQPRTPVRSRDLPAPAVTARRFLKDPANCAMVFSAAAPRPGENNNPEGAFDEGENRP